MSVIEKLKEQENFTPNEKAIADYILDNQESIINLVSHDLANEVYVSPSAVVRFCKKLGFTGYRDFVIEFTRDLELFYQQTNQVDVNYPFTEVDSDSLVAQKIAVLSNETILETRSLLSEKLLNQASDLIINASDIFAIGVSHSFNRILDFQTKMLRINKYVKTIHLQSDQFHLVNTTKENDVAILVSYGGLTSEILSDVKVLKKNKTKIIAITSNLHSGIAKYADVVLPLPKKEDAESNISSFASQISSEYILNVLYSCIYKRQYSENIRNIRSAPTSYLSSLLKK